MDLQRFTSSAKLLAYILTVFWFASGISGLLPYGDNNGQIPLRESLEVAHSSQSDKASLAVHCPGYDFPQVVCINRYGSLIRGDFERKVRNVLADGDTYPSTSAPGEPTMAHVSDADFLVWDIEAGLQILGPNPSVEFMFDVGPVSHEAPVYSPATNELYFSRLVNGFLPQLVVDLSHDPPTLSERLAKPPIYAAAGSRYYKGLIYFATIGGNDSLAGYSFRPGIYTLDPRTGKSNAILNNYYGYYFNSADDLDIDDDGQIWFTDNSKFEKGPSSIRVVVMGCSTSRPVL
ncbi:hypothetical protein O1611_g6499 [Lasiodiplodia mahajangana]|uniref:Uncharacterized protein n=1 Tax=Lasiodiplodia mahajangana TaxID=1108764 RepID=A0ACC2JI85_9PEZI|nr:hypothetical protein O1611_g6499 [Lasiodiplodia mahajangana]